MTSGSSRSRIPPPAPNSLGASCRWRPTAPRLNGGLSMLDTSLSLRGRRARTYFRALRTPRHPFPAAASRRRQEPRRTGCRRRRDRRSGPDRGIGRGPRPGVGHPRAPAAGPARPALTGPRRHRRHVTARTAPTPWPPWPPWPPSPPTPTPPETRPVQDHAYSRVKRGPRSGNRSPQSGTDRRLYESGISHRQDLTANSVSKVSHPVCPRRGVPARPPGRDALRGQGPGGQGWGRARR